MCLCNFNEVHLTEPITVYKVLFKCSNETYRSPYHDYLWTMGMTHYNHDVINIYESKYWERKLCEGVFHCYEHLEDAIIALRLFRCSTLSYVDRDMFKVVRLTIPADAKKVYHGTYGDNVPCYASTAVKLEEELEVGEEDMAAAINYKGYVLIEESNFNNWPKTKEQADAQVKKVVEWAEKRSLLFGSFREEKEAYIDSLYDYRDKYYKFKGWDYVSV